MFRTELKNLTIVNDTTQIDNNGTKYEMYGSTDNGLIFERCDEGLLYHVSNGVKLFYRTNTVTEGSFFRDGKSNFFQHYRNIKDYDYKEQIMSEYDIIKSIKEYLYLHSPSLYLTTMMGYDTDKGILANPNYCTAEVMLDNKLIYTIIKRYDTVKIYIGSKNKFEFDKSNDENNVIIFKLDKVLYEKALGFNNLKRKIITGLFGNFDSKNMNEYVKLEEEIKNCLKEN